MRWTPKDQSFWHAWFAWRPVYVKGGDKVWLRSVQRRWRGGMTGWEYAATVFEI